MEEAGLKAELNGILRLEYSLGTSFVRFRCVFAASPEDPSAGLKTEADDETYGAAWFTLQEVIALAKTDPKMIEKVQELPYRVTQREAGTVKRRHGINGTTERIRGMEILSLFQWAERGTTSFPLELYAGSDGQSIDNKKVKVNTKYSVALVVKRLGDDTFLLVNDDLPRVDLSELEEFEKVAKNICSEVRKQVLSVKVKRKAPKVTLALKGICGMLHTPPQSFDKKAAGHVCLTYYAEIKMKESSFDFSAVAKSESNLSLGWKTAEEVSEMIDALPQETGRVLTNCIQGKIAPLNFLAFEGDTYVSL